MASGRAPSLRLAPKPWGKTRSVVSWLKKVEAARRHRLTNLGDRAPARHHGSEDAANHSSQVAVIEFVNLLAEDSGLGGHLVGHLHLRPSINLSVSSVG